MKKCVKPIIVITILLSMIALFLAGCSRESKKVKDTGEPRADFPVTVTDDTGRKLKLETEPKQLVSLAPSNTEILFALGLGEKVVGVSTYCDYPRAAKNKEKIGDFSNPNVERILSLRPDLVFANTGIQMSAVEALEKLGVSVYIVDSKSLDGVLSSIRKIGKATGTKGAARTLVRKMDAEIAEVREKTASLSDSEKPQVFYELYSDPLMTAGPGSFIDSMIKVAGGINIAADATGEYPQFSLETLLQKDPQIYIAVKGPMVDPGDISKRSGWQNITAVKLSKIYLVDDNLVSRPGPRIVKGLKSIARAIHPDLYED